MFEQFGRISFTHHTKVEKFVRHLEDGWLMVSVCKGCGRRSFPPRADCPACCSGDFSYVASSKRGKVLSFTRIHAVPAGFEGQEPYLLAVVELDDGGRLLAPVAAGTDEAEIEVDARVQVAIRRLQAADGGGETSKVVYEVEAITTRESD